MYNGVALREPVDWATCGCSGLKGWSSELDWSLAPVDSEFGAMDLIAIWLPACEGVSAGAVLFCDLRHFTRVWVVAIVPSFCRHLVPDPPPIAA